MTTQSEKLKPCPNPWCDDRCTDVCNKEGGFFRVECFCGVKGPTATDEEQAARLWNTRPLSMTGEAPDFAEMLDVLEDCRRYLTEFGSIEPSSLAFRVKTAITNGKRARDDRCYREQWAHANGARAARDEPPLTYSQFLAGAEPPPPYRSRANDRQ